MNFCVKVEIIQFMLTEGKQRPQLSHDTEKSIKDCPIKFAKTLEYQESDKAPNMTLFSAGAGLPIEDIYFQAQYN